MVIGIAANADEHLEILGRIVDRMEEPEDVLNLVEGGDKQAVFDMLAD